MGLGLRPITRDEAAAFIREHHRHHGVPVGDLWRHAAVDDCGCIVGVAVCGRPVARELDDGLTMEVTRMCTDGEPNANSILYAAAERTAIAKGYRRRLTYLLASEWDRFRDPVTGEVVSDPSCGGRRVGGAGVRAIGWQELWRVKGRSWDCKSRPRTDKHPTQDKVAIGAGAWPQLAQAEAA